MPGVSFQGVAKLRKIRDMATGGGEEGVADVAGGAVAGEEVGECVEDGGGIGGGVEEMDGDKEARGGEGEGGAFVVGGGCADAAGGVAEHGESGYVEIAAAYSAVWFPFAAYSEGYVGAIDFVGVEAAY